MKKNERNRVLVASLWYLEDEDKIKCQVEIDRDLPLILLKFVHEAINEAVEEEKREYAKRKWANN